MGYTVKELGKIIGRKPAMIYNYIKEDRSFFYSHREMGTNGSYLYDDEVLERLKIKVGVSNGVAGEIIEKENEISPQHTPAPSTESEEAIKKLISELEEVKSKYEEIKLKLEQVEAERKQLLEQNGNLLLLLSQEKAEKQKLLPPPHRSIGERIRGFFHRPPNAGNENGV